MSNESLILALRDFVVRVACGRHVARVDSL